MTTVLTLIMCRHMIHNVAHFPPLTVECDIRYILKHPDCTAEDIRSIGALLRRQATALTYKDTPHDVGAHNA